MLVYKYRFILARYLISFFFFFFSVADLSIEEEDTAVKQQDFTVNVFPSGHS